MRIGANNTTGMSARNRREGDSTFLEYQRDRQAELDAEKAAAEAAQAAADAQNPELMFKRTADAEVQAIRELILTGYVPTELLPGDRVNGRKINEDVAASNFKLWAQQESTFQRYMFETLYAVMKRNDLAPIANNFGALHRLLLQYAAYPDEPVQPVQVAAPQEVDTRTPSEIAEAKYKARMTDIVVYDPIDNRGYTEFDLENKVDAKTERRLRRLMEGKIGNNNYDTYMELRDLNHQQELDRVRRAEEDER